MSFSLHNEDFNDIFSVHNNHGRDIPSYHQRRSRNHEDWLTTEEQLHQALLSSSSSSSTSTTRELRVLKTFRSETISLHRLWFRLKHHSKQNLLSLALRGMPIDAQDVDDLFQAVPHVKHLQLGPVTLSGLKRVMSLERVIHLESLQLTGSPEIHIERRLSLSPILLYSTKLKVLHLCHVPLNLSCMLAESNHTSIPSIQSLKLTYCNLNDHDVIFCLASGQLSALQQLDLSHNRIQHASTLIPLLQQIPSLETLRLDHNPWKLSDKSYKTLVAAIGQTRVRRLSIDHHSDPSLPRAVAEALQANAYLQWASCAVSSLFYHRDDSKYDNSEYTLPHAAQQLQQEQQHHEKMIAYYTLLNRNGRSCIRQSASWYSQMLVKQNPIISYGLLQDQMNWLSWTAANSQSTTTRG